MRDFEIFEGLFRREEKFFLNAERQRGKETERLRDFRFFRREEKFFFKRGEAKGQRDREVEGF